MQKSRIEWTEQTANPIIGCSNCSAACDHCYALTMARRIAGMNGQVGDDYRRVLTPDRKEWNGKTVFNPEVLRQIIRRKKPTTYFIGSMGDLFHPSVQDDWLDQIMETVFACPQHRFMVLTKRPERMKEYMLHQGSISQDERGRYSSFPFPPKNLALGVSVWDQESADRAIPLLLQTPASKRFVSAEPMLGPIDLNSREFLIDKTRFKYTIGEYLDLVIVGGETGHGARPMHPDWARQMRDQCAEANVPLMFKQWGEWVAPSQSLTAYRIIEDFGGGVGGGDYEKRVGKKLAGRLLDGIEHNGSIQW